MSCPYINNCNKEVDKSYFEKFCTCNYAKCPTFLRMKKKEERKKPREWLDEEQPRKWPDEDEELIDLDLLRGPEE